MQQILTHLLHLDLKLGAVVMQKKYSRQKSQIRTIRSESIQISFANLTPNFQASSIGQRNHNLLNLECYLNSERVINTRRTTIHCRIF